MHFALRARKAAAKLSKIVGNLKKPLRRAVKFREMLMMISGIGPGASFVGRDGLVTSALGCIGQTDDAWPALPSRGDPI